MFAGQTGALAMGTESKNPLVLTVENMTIIRISTLPEP